MAVFMGLAAAALLVGCDGGDTGALTETTPRPSALPEASAPDPNIRESATAQPGFDTGHTVHITTHGIQPTDLASLCCDPVVFKNESGATVSVNFNNYKVSSGPIAPGTAWQWVPTVPISLIYHLGTDLTQRGHIQIESPSW